MDTSAIGHRVVDFLTRHPPFQAMGEADLLELAARGRVRFHEANEYILWQGEPHKLHVFVIQHGTVSLWDEADGHAALADVRGAGDMLGIERFNGAPWCLNSARSASDVVTYAFPATDFETLLLKYPDARQFVEAYDTVTSDYQWATDAHDPQRTFLHDAVGSQGLASCDAGTSVAAAAQALLATGSEAIAVVDDQERVAGMVTVNGILAWVAAGGGDTAAPVSRLLAGGPPALGPGASVVDAALALAATAADALVVTADGSLAGRLQAVVTAREIGRAFGDQPVAILREIRLATTTAALRALNHRTRALALQYLTSAASLDWLARFVSLADQAIVTRLIALTGSDLTDACWCVCGAAGRGESLTRHAPQLVLLVDDDQVAGGHRTAHQRVGEALAACDFMSRTDLAFEPAFLVASVAEWQRRCRDWLDDPVRSQMYLARPLFDLRPIHGRDAPWRAVEETIVGAVNRDLLQVLANDCLASLPPLTFYQDAVVDESGEQTDVFRLEHSALLPLVDVGRVFGMASGHLLGTSTLERFARARARLPEHEAIFREASDTLRVLLWQQARIGISQGTSGSDLPPALLSRHDRHVLKSGFRSILRLLEFAGNSQWFDAL